MRIKHAYTKTARFIKLYKHRSNNLNTYYIEDNETAKDYFEWGLDETGLYFDYVLNEIQNLD